MDKEAIQNIAKEYFDKKAIAWSQYLNGSLPLNRYQEHKLYLMEDTFSKLLKEMSDG
jgi:hypothetical protein